MDLKITTTSTHSGFTPSGRGNKGFTLVEMLVIIFIIGLMGAALFTSTRSDGGAADVRNAGEEVVTVLRRAQSGALSGYRSNGGTVSNLRVSFNTADGGSYSLCADVPRCSGTSIEKISLQPGIAITSLLYRTSSTVTATAADIVFTPPYADVSFFYTGSGSGQTSAMSGQMEITLENQEGESKKVTIDALSGRVSLE